MHTTAKQTYIQQDQVRLGTHVEAFHQSCTVGKKKQITNRCNVQLIYRNTYKNTRLRIQHLNEMTKRNPYKVKGPSYLQQITTNSR